MRHHSFPIWIPEKPAAPQPLARPDIPTEAPAPEHAYGDLLKRELLELAEGRGLDVSSRDTKAEILAILVASDG